MVRSCLKGPRRYLAWTCAVLVATAGVSRAGDSEAELRAKIEEQGRQIQELKKQMDQNLRPAGDGKDGGSLNEGAVKKIVEGYLKDKAGRFKNSKSKWTRICAPPGTAKTAAV